MVFLQSNRITQIEGLEKLTHLDQLYLSHNGVTKIEGLETLVCAPEIRPAYNELGYRKYTGSHSQRVRYQKYTGSRLQRVRLPEIHWFLFTMSSVTRNNPGPTYYEAGYRTCYWLEMRCFS